MSRKTQNFTRKAHRYLGAFIGIQFFFWTLGGLYFSWNSMDDVHGESLIDATEQKTSITHPVALAKILDSLQTASTDFAVQQIEGLVVASDSLIRITGKSTTYLINPKEKTLQKTLSKAACKAFVKSRLKEPITIGKVVLLTQEDVAVTHEYRGKPLPVYAMHLEHPTHTVVYVHPGLAKITSVRNDNWRRFDFLWMLHVMDYETRDHITNWTLRVFSVLGLLTILSGFYLFYLSSPTLRKLKKRYKKAK